jgi:hypothetical protein
MKKAVIIYNGLHFYLPLADKAFEWAKVRKCPVVAIFLKVKHEPSQGYVFPSDIVAAESLSTNKDADISDKQTIDSCMKLLEHQAAKEHIELSVILLVNPTSEEIEKQLMDCDAIFMQQTPEDLEHLPIAGVNVKELLKDVNVPVEIVH